MKVDPASFGILGPQGSYSEEASTHYKKNIRPIFFDTIQDVLQAVVSNKVSQAILPLENSIKGKVAETSTGLAENNLKIIEKITIPIHHSLAGISKNIPETDIKYVYSHIQALGQCTQYLTSHYPHAEYISTASTSGALKKIKDDNLYDSLAIGSKFGAQLYGLHILKEGIEDFKDNHTLFVVVSKGNSH